MQKKRLTSWIILSCATLVFLLPLGCGGGGGSPALAAGPTPTPGPTETPTPTPSPTPTPAPVSVSISAASGSVQVAHSLQWTARVSGTSNQAVSWAVNGIAGGNSSVGTINASGLFTAPNVVPIPASVTVSAVSAADITKSASAPLSVIPPPSPEGSWVRSAPFGGLISNLAADPKASNVLYVAAFNSGVFKSTDSGQTWTAVIPPQQAGFQNNQISSIAVGSVSSTLYFVNGQPPNPLILYSSVDGGTTIAQKTVPASPVGSTLSLDPENDNTIYLSGPNGIAKSIDGANTWTNLGSAPGNVNVLSVDPKNSQIIYVGTSSGVFKSADAGNSWNAANSGINSSNLFVVDIAIDQTNSQRIFAATNATSTPTGHIYLTTNAATGWTEVTAGSATWPGRTVFQIQLNGNTLYASTDTFNTSGPPFAPVLKSGDAGSTWAAASIGLPAISASSTGGLLLFSTSPDSLLFGDTGPFSLLRSSDGASSWQQASTGLSGFSGQRITLDPSSNSTLYFGSTNSGGLWKSADTGTTWTNVLVDSIFAVAVDPFNSAHLLASDFGQFVLQSTDGGTTWAKVTTPFAEINDIGFSPKQSGLILSCSRGAGIARSTDNGNTWTAANTGLQGNAADCIQVALDPKNANIVFAATNGGIYGSTDGGQSWSIRQSTPQATIKIDPTDSSVVYAGGTQGFFKSTDGGNTWAQLDVPLFGFPVAISIDPLSHNTVYVSTFGGGKDVEVSTDAGQTWATVGSNLGFALINDLVVIPGTSKLFAATFNNGVLQFK